MTNRHISRYSCVFTALFVLLGFAGSQLFAAQVNGTGYPVDGATAIKLTSNLKVLLAASRKACQSAQHVVDGGTPQSTTLQAAITSLTNTSIDQLTFRNQQKKSIIRSFGDPCAGSDASDPNTDIKSLGSPLTVKDTKGQFSSSMKDLAMKIQGLVKAGNDLIGSSQKDSDLDELRADLQSIAAPWAQLKDVGNKLSQSRETSAIGFSFGTLPAIASAATGLQADASQTTPVQPTPVDTGTKTNDDQDHGKKQKENPPSKSLLQSPLPGLIFDVILLVLLIVIVLKVRDSSVLQLSTTQEQALVSATESVSALSTRVSELKQQVQTLMNALTIFEQEQNKRAQSSSQVSQASIDAALEARRPASTPASPQAPPIVRVSKDDPSPATFNLAFDESSSDAGMGQNVPAEIGFAAAEPAPDPDASSGDPVKDYNRARSMGGDGEFWFRSHYSPTDLACENLDALKASSSAQVRFVRDIRGSFLAVRSAGNGDAYLAFPAFTFDPGSSRQEFEGVFTYRSIGGSKSRLSRAAILLQRGDMWYLDNAGEIQNG